MSESGTTAEGTPNPRPGVPTGPWYRRRTWLGGLAVCVVALAVVTLLTRQMWGADAPFAGTWEVTVFQGDESLTLCLLKIEEKGGKARAEVVSSFPGFKKGVTVEDFTAEGRALHFTLKTATTTWKIAAYAPEGDERPKKLLGSLGHNGQRQPLWMELTDKRELTEKNASHPTPGWKALSRLDEVETPKEQEAGFEGILKKYPNTTVAFLAAQSLFQLKILNDAPASELRPAADQAIRLASTYGREMTLQATTQVARGLVRSGKEPRLGLSYARKAERELNENDPAASQVAVLKVLLKALQKTGKAKPEEQKGLEERLAKLEGQLDEEFTRRAVPFKVEPFGGRKAKSDRVAVVELFTGAYCPPCVGADIAFDAALKAYKPSDVILLQYHLHAPRPDPLTNAGSEARAEFYGAEGTPSLFIDGKGVRNVGGGREDGKESFDALSKVVDENLETPAEAQVKLSVKRSGDRLDLEAEVSDLKKTGKDVRLRFVLIEDMVRFPGSNGQRLHHHVVRAFPGGEKGFALTGKSDKQTVRVEVGNVRKTLSDYLETANKKHPFAADDRPLELKHLKVVALVQDDKSKEILQAAQADVPAKP